MAATERRVKEGGLEIDTEHMKTLEKHRDREMHKHTSIHSLTHRDTYHHLCEKANIPVHMSPTKHIKARTYAKIYTSAHLDSYTKHISIFTKIQTPLHT